MGVTPIYEISHICKLYEIYFIQFLSIKIECFLTMSRNIKFYVTGSNKKTNQEQETKIKNEVVNNITNNFSTKIANNFSNKYKDETEINNINKCMNATVLNNKFKFKANKCMKSKLISPQEIKANIVQQCIQGNEISNKSFADMGVEVKNEKELAVENKQDTKVKSEVVSSQTSKTTTEFGDFGGIIIAIGIIGCSVCACICVFVFIIVAILLFSSSSTNTTPNYASNITTTNS